MQLTIERPQCDWVAMPPKDRRRGSFWLCKACGHRKKAKKQPLCPCNPISITQQITTEGK